MNKVILGIIVGFFLRTIVASLIGALMTLIIIVVLGVAGMVLGSMFKPERP